MRIVTNKELSSYKVLPFDLYTENKGKILEAGEVLTPGKLIMLKNYVKIYTEEFGSEEESDAARSAYYKSVSGQEWGNPHGYELCIDASVGEEAAADLSRQVQTKMADKFYYAVTDGVPEQKKGTLEDYLLRDGKTNTSKVVSKSTEGAKSARLDYEVTAQNKTNAILRIRLDTGRHHQIRVQLANAGIPIVGDAKYNFKEAMTRSGNGLLLCSYKIGFKHPKTHKKMEFEIRNPFLI